jgi:transaldolase
MIKIPATVEGLPAITAAIAAGISVNVTLIFSLERYGQVIDAYFEGLEQAAKAGIDLSTIHSVASFFVSRVDTEVDKRLDAIGSDEATALKSKAAIANARLAYKLFVERFATERAIALQEQGANRQRPLWASTGTKDPSLPDTLYVTELVTHGVVNTMPEKTLEAVADHGRIEGDTVVDRYEEAQQVFDRLAALGIDIAEVSNQLEREGVEKFIQSWHELTDTVTRALETAKA